MTEEVGLDSKGVSMRFNWKTLAVIVAIVFSSGTGGSVVAQWLNPVDGIQELEIKVSEMQKHDDGIHKQLEAIQATQIRLVTLSETMQRQIDRLLDERLDWVDRINP